MLDFASYIRGILRQWRLWSRVGRGPSLIYKTSPTFDNHHHYRLSVIGHLPCGGIVASRDAKDRCIELYNKLSEKDKQYVRKKITSTRKRYNKKYSEIIPLVEEHLMSHGSITNIEAFELGLTDTEMHSTTFRRCVIAKLSFDVKRKSLPDRRVCYYLPGLQSSTTTTEHTTVGPELVATIMSTVDFSKKTVNLRSLLDSDRYPILSHSQNLAKLGPMLVEEMMRRGYTRSSRNLDFTREV